MQLSILVKSIILILCVVVGMLVFSYLESIEIAEDTDDTNPSRPQSLETEAVVSF